jgi:hypothetical protein
VDDEIKNGSIKHYFRYVDDIFCLIWKNEKKTFFEKLNKFNHGLKLTMENVRNNQIVFLDTTVVNKNGNLYSEMYRKPTASENIINFKHAVTPKCQKISNLVGEIPLTPFG